jgi:predicted nucleic acid-binding protein
VIVVRDTSPLTNLAVVSRLDLLPALYQRVLVPHAIFQELRVGETTGSHPRFLDSSGWLEVCEVSDREEVTRLLGKLDLGEAEAIVLAVERKAGLLLIDERKGRSVASGKGIETIGLLGTLVAAQRKRLIPAVKPVLDRLIREAGFWVSAALYQEVLRRAGE